MSRRKTVLTWAVIAWGAYGHYSVVWHAAHGVWWPAALVVTARALVGWAKWWTWRDEKNDTKEDA